MLSIAYLASLLVAQIALLALALRLGGCWSGVERYGWGRCVLSANLLIALGAAAIAAASQWHIPDNVLLWLGIHIGVAMSVVAIIMRSTLKQTMIIMAMLLGVNVLMAGFVFGVGQPFVVETFYNPSNGMAPSLRGEHVTGVCQACGGQTVQQPPDRTHLPSLAGDYTAMTICASCYKSDLVTGTQQRELVRPGDRFTANKLRRPARWDIAVFRPASSPETVYVQRVVALPGEMVQMVNHQLLINGQAITPPAHCSKIKFGALPDNEWMERSALAGYEPLQLGPDEYFMIGDNQTASLDSRFEGPVPSTNLIGVAELIYWPPARIHLLP